jgi:hypothetical protein
MILAPVGVAKSIKSVVGNLIYKHKKETQQQAIHKTFNFWTQS